MQQEILNYLNNLPKYTFTVTIDLSLVALLVIGLILLSVSYCLIIHLKKNLLDADEDIGELEISSPSTSTRRDVRDGIGQTKVNESSIRTGGSSPRSGRNNNSFPPNTPTTNSIQPVSSQQAPFTTPKSKGSNYSIDQSTNTIYDLEEFMTRLFKSYFVVYRYKDGSLKLESQKKRLMKMNDHCELIFYKNFQEKGPLKRNESQMTETASVHTSMTNLTDASSITKYIAMGSPYIRLPLSELVQCIVCDEESFSGGTHRTFLLEFKHKTMHLRASLGIDNSYLIKGFQQLIARINADKSYLDHWKGKMKSGGDLSSPVPLPPSSNKKKRQPKASSKGDGISSDESVDFGSIYSFNTTSERVVEDVDTRLARKRYSELKQAAEDKANRETIPEK